MLAFADEPADSFLLVGERLEEGRERVFRTLACDREHVAADLINLLTPGVSLTRWCRPPKAERVSADALQVVVALAVKAGARVHEAVDLR